MNDILGIIAALFRIEFIGSGLIRAARNRADPEPMVRGRTAAICCLVVAIAVTIYIRASSTLFAKAHGFAVFLAVVLAFCALIAALLAGNQLDAALSRRRLNARRRMRYEKRQRRRARKSSV